MTHLPPPVSDVRITDYEDYHVMWGASLEIQFMVDGGRPPFLIEVSYPNHETFVKYYLGNDSHCQNHGVNWKECKKTIDVIDYSHEGRYVNLRRKPSLVVYKSFYGNHAPGGT